MTVPSTTSRDQQTGNGVTTVFTVPFRVLDQTHLRVLLTVAGVTTEQTLTTHYSVSNIGAANTTVTFVAAPTSGAKVTFLRNVPATQETDYVPNDPFPAESHERALDKLTMLFGQLDEVAGENGRTIKIPAEVSGVSTTMPAPEAATFWGWNADATAPELYTLSDIATTVVFQSWRAQTFAGDGVTQEFDLADDPGNIANLDVSIDGVVQVPTTDYGLLGTQLVFTIAPADGAVVLVRYGQAVSEQAPANTEVIEVSVSQGATVVAVPGSAAVGQIVMVSYNGVLQHPSAYSVAGASVHFTEALPADGTVAALVTNIPASSVSAGNIGFTAAGTGATTRTVGNKLRDVVSVKDFGAEGDGVTDDSDAFSAAAATGRKVLVPDGTYLVHGVLLESSVHFVGEGPASIIKLADDTAPNLLAPLLSRPTTFMFGLNALNIRVGFEGLLFDCNESGQSVMEPYNTAIFSAGLVPASAEDRIDLTIERCEFRDICLGAVNIGFEGAATTDMLGTIRVSRTVFRDARGGIAAGDPDSGSATGFSPTFVSLQRRTEADISECQFVQKKSLGASRYAPVAVFVSSTDTLAAEDQGGILSVSGSYFYGVGRSDAAGNGLGVIDAYIRARDVRVTGNSFEDCAAAPMRAKNNVASLVVADNTMRNCVKMVTVGSDGGNNPTGRIAITGNIGTGITGDNPLSVTGNSDALPAQCATIANNIIGAAGATGSGAIYARYFYKVVVDGNVVNGSGTDGIYVNDCRDVAVTGNVVDSAVAGFDISGNDGRVAIAGNTANNCSSAGFDARTNTGTVTLSGNVCDTVVDYGFIVGGAANFAHSGNIAVGVSGLSRGFRVEATALVVTHVGNITNATTATSFVAGPTYNAAANSWP